MDKPLITIIIPVYKVENYLKRCLNSVIRQDYSNLEILLIDDGSPDKSGEICDLFAQKDSRIVVVHKKNGGVSSARNKGIEIAKGEYICFLDADDYLRSNYVSSMFEAIESKKSDLVVATSYNRMFTKCVHEYVDEKNIIFDDFQNNTTDIFLDYHLNSPWCKFFKRNIIRNNDIFFLEKIGWGEDRCFVFDYLKYCKKISFINKEIYVYNSLLSLATRKYWENMTYFCVTNFNIYKEFIEKKFSFLDNSINLKKYALIMFETAAKHYCQFLDEEEAIKKIEEVYNCFNEYLNDFAVMDGYHLKYILNKDWSELYDYYLSLKKSRLAYFCQKKIKDIWTFLYKLGLF